MPRATATKRRTIIVKDNPVDVRRIFNQHTPDDVIDIIEKLRQEYSEYSFLCNFDVRFVASHFNTLRIRVSRLETDAEYDRRMEKNRLARERRQQTKDQERAKIEARERLLYEKLHKKYGSCQENHS